MFRDSSGKDEGRTRDKHHQSTQSLSGILYLNNAIFHQSLVDLNEKDDLQRIRREGKDEDQSKQSRIDYSF